MEVLGKNNLVAFCKYISVFFINFYSHLVVRSRIVLRDSLKGGGHDNKNLANVSHANLMNGDFSVVPDLEDLNGWESEEMDINYNFSSPSSSVSANSGYAVLETQGYLSEITLISLWQSIEIPDWAYTLSFDIGFERTDHDDGGFGSFTIPDFFEVSYWDYSDPNFDQLLLGVDLNGPYDPNTWANIDLPEHEADGINWYRFVADISDLGDRYGALYFDLSDQDDNYT